MVGVMGGRSDPGVLRSSGLPGVSEELRNGSRYIPANRVSNAGNKPMVLELMMSSAGDDYHVWRFVTNHAHVLTCIAADPSARLRDIAATVGITERTTAAILNDLEEAGYLTRSRDGRRNVYEVHDALPLRHPSHRHHTVGDMIHFLEAPRGRERQA